jgi:hypothetical protein
MLSKFEPEGREFEVYILKCCLCVRTWDPQISEMARRMGLKFGGCAQEGWQSVLHKKKIKKTSFES